MNALYGVVLLFFSYFTASFSSVLYFEFLVVLSEDDSQRKGSRKMLEASILSSLFSFRASFDIAYKEKKSRTKRQTFILFDLSYLEIRFYRRIRMIIDLQGLLLKP